MWTGNPEVVRLGLHDRLGQRLEVSFPGVVALGEPFQAALDEGHALAELEFLLVVHGQSFVARSTRSVTNSESSPEVMRYSISPSRSSRFSGIDDQDFSWRTIRVRYGDVPVLDRGSIAGIDDGVEELVFDRESSANSTEICRI